MAAADGDRSFSTPLTRYYNAEGTPPGRWLGAGVAGLGGGQIADGELVSEAQLQLLTGIKQSGLGREGGAEGIQEYLSTTYTMTPGR